MDKKEYITPESEQIIITMEASIASPGDTEPGTGDDY